MSIKNNVFKICFLSAVFAASFHMLGVEAAFCDDGMAQDASAHGCTVCQPGHHSVTIETSKVIPSLTLSSFLPMENRSLSVEEMIRPFFRPPISL